MSSSLLKSFLNYDVIPINLFIPFTHFKLGYCFCDNIYCLNNMKKRQGQLKETPSKVLLTCVYDTVIIDVTNEVVYSRFSPFGPILKILIF